MKVKSMNNFKKDFIVPQPVLQKTRLHKTGSVDTIPNQFGYTNNMSIQAPNLETRYKSNVS